MSLKLGVNEIYRAALLTASSRTNIDASALAALVDAEAAKEGGVWQADSYNPTSKAAGLTQFLESTWLDQAVRGGTLLNETAVSGGLVKAGEVVDSKRSALLKLRFDSLLSIFSAAEYGVSNLKYLEKKKVLPDGISDDERAKFMYLAHHEGAAGAVGYLTGSKKYTKANLEGQVGKAQAALLIQAAGGDANAAYRSWLKDYIDRKIVPSEFRQPPAFGAPAGAPAPGAAVSAAFPPGPAYVTTEGLRFRRTPDGDIIGELTIATKVKVLGPRVDQWQEVEIGGTRGFVSNRYLRLPIPDPKEALLANAVAEWVRFKKGEASEKDDPYYKYVGEMWDFIGLSYDGKSKYPDGRDVPWSAAFISFVVGKAGPAYRKFKFDASHSQFSHDAIQARILARTDRPFWGFRITEKRPELGDIVHRNRSGNTFSYDYAENHSAFESHSDVVVEVREQTIRVIGGNVSNTVSLKEYSNGDDLQEYELNADGYLKSGQSIIALLKNRAEAVV